MKKFLTEQQRKQNLAELETRIAESFAENFNKIKRLDEQTVFQGLEELSPETTGNAIQKMKDKGQDRRADKWVQHYGTKDLEQFRGTQIFEDEVIGGFQVEDDKIIIHHGSPRSKEFNRSQGTVVYNIPKDVFWYLPHKVTRKSARVLAKIAMIINPETQYSNGTGDFKLDGY